MFYRFAVKEGAHIINMSQISEIILKGKVVTLYFKHSGLAGGPFVLQTKPIFQTFTYDTQKAADESFQQIYEYLEKTQMK